MLLGRVAGLATALLTMAALTGSAVAAEIGDPAGPLTSVGITPDLNCSVHHTGDTHDEFYTDPFSTDAPAACGTFVAADGTLYGPAFVPAGGGATPRTGWTAVSQPAPSGAGTAADPRTVTTEVTGGALRVKQTDSYVVGQESYRTDVSVTNTGAATASVVVYRAGDCYLQDSDFGLGFLDPANGSVGCKSPQSARIEGWYPITSGSSALEAFYNDLWRAVGSQSPFPNTCRCTENIDNGGGLSWRLSIPAGATAQVSNLTTFSPRGEQPLDTTKTADQGAVLSGADDGYTITLHNPNPQDVSVNSISDTLPAGFSYRPGTTTGATTADPAVTGQDLKWGGPLIIPADGSISLHFGVRTTATPGTYYNNAGADAGDLAVTPTGNTAPVTVTAPPPKPTQMTATPVTVRLSLLRVYIPTVNATLTSNGTPLAGRTVTFTAGAQQLCTAKTNSAGTATCSNLVISLTAALHLGYTASYAGEGGSAESPGGYLPSSAKGALLGL